MDKRVTVGHAGRSPPHERVDVFFHHAVERQPHPVPPPVEHVVPPSHQPTAERTALRQERLAFTLYYSIFRMLYAYTAIYRVPNVVM